MRLFAVLVIACSAFAQAPPQFEVASVKLQPWTGTNGRVGVFVRGDTLNAEHASLYALVEFAYDLRDEQLSGGPAWANRANLKLVDAELYQVIAKVSSNPPPPMDVFRRMLQTLLAERFQLQVHHVQKNLPVYNLTIDKGGPKLKQSAPETKFTSRTDSPSRYGIRIAASHYTMQQVADNFGGYSGRPVFDKTGLTAAYDFTLEFSAQNMTPGGTAEGESIFTAVRGQLGLKLEAATAPFDTVVIDRAERPSTN